MQKTVYQTLYELGRLFFIILYFSRSDVQNPHLLAPIGTLLRQYGHSLVVTGAASLGISLFTCLTMRNTAVAMIKKLIIWFRKMP